MAEQTKTAFQEWKEAGGRLTPLPLFWKRPATLPAQLTKCRPFLQEGVAGGADSFNVGSFLALVAFVLVVGSWMMSAGRMFWNSGTLLFGSGSEEGESKPVPVLPVVVNRSSPTVEPLVVAPTGEAVELAPTPTPVVVELVAGEPQPGDGGAQVTSTAAPGCVVYCRVVAHCAELERRNPGCVVEWPEE